MSAVDDYRECREADKNSHGLLVVRAADAAIAELEAKNERLTKDRAHFSESYAALHARFAQQQTKLEQAAADRDRQRERANTAVERAEQAEAELAERDRMLDEAWRWAWGYTMTKDDWLADIRARAKEGAAVKAR